jgi:hypothetical protein
MKLIVRLSLLSLLLVALPAAAQPLMDWNMVGSAGSVDEAAAAGFIYAYTNMTAHFAGGNLGTIVLRYPVTNTWGTAFGGTVPPWNTMEVAHVDNGAAASVVARLFQVNRCTNVQAQIAIMNSLDGPAGPVCGVVPVPPLNFGTNIYYIEVTLTRTAVAGTPSVQYVALY